MSPAVFSLDDLMTSKEQIFEIEVEFGDCDPAGIVYFPNFFRWMDASSRHFFQQCGVPAWRELTPLNGIIGTPLVDTQAKFQSPAVYGERIRVTTSIAEWRQKSFVHKHVISRDDVVLVECLEVRVFARRHPDDPERIQAVPVPDDIRRLCEQD